MSLESSLVRIFKNPNDRTVEGAGVYIGARRLLTCTHVVQAVVPNPEQDAVYIDFPLLGDPAIFKAKAAPGCYLEPKPTPDSNRPGDICLLEIETGAALPENLQPAMFFDPDEGHCTQRTVHTCGFPEHMEMGERAYGQLIGPIEGGWVQLDAALTSRTVAPGYSGAPVWDQQTNQVAGIIVTRSVRDGQVAAYMIPTIQLAHLAPNILKKQTQATHECLPISFKRKCDRGAEITAFINYIKNMCDLGNCHHLFFVMGPRRACHVSLSKRLGESTRVRRALEKGLAREVLVEHLIIPWPVDDKPENGMDILLPPLFDQIYKTKQGYQDDTGPHDFVELCRRLNLTNQSVYLVSHKPAPITKIKPFVAVFNEYIKGFWSQIPCHDDLPLFILVFNIEIDDVSGPFARWRSQKSHKMLQKVVAKVMDNAQKQFNGMQFDPLRTITRHDLENWFYRYCSHIDFSEKLMRQGLKRIFKEHKMVDMEIVEEWLEEIVDTIDRKLASAYLRES